MPTTPLGTIHANPVKSFFVHMLTRDISLQDAILDLLDNCVDGVQRIAPKSRLTSRKPYKGYWAEIEFSGDSFSIKDNCGGIPWKYRDYAFRMGRIKSDIDKGLKTVGVYGIGMKRAIFKIGEDCTISTHATDGSYEIHISSEWMNNDNVWDVDAFRIKTRNGYGTRIAIKNLRSTIAKEFQSTTFLNEFCSTVATHFAYIMDKGFTVNINGKPLKPKSLQLLFADGRAGEQHGIRPFIYKTKHNGVEVFLAVGFTRPIPSSEEANESFENYKERYSSAEAGWTIICNDRTVLYCDKTALTGWGVSGVPQYHMQFIAISGIVIFDTEDPILLPTTTTKRGIDASSELYLHIRDKMIEGMKIFTHYTNQWKTKELAAESKSRFKETPFVDIEETMAKASSLPLTMTHVPYSGHQYKPILPRPTQQKTIERILFSRPVKEIRRVSSYLFQSPDKRPAEVGEKCFEVILQEASE